jgi:ABC-type transport system involved in cytochrome bd biosynthesis fused ATPase/permease subunit
MNNAKFKWLDDPVDEEPANFTFDISKGDVLGITGPHSKTLIHSILGHCELVAGQVRQRGKIAYFPEEPFITLGSLKSNILMGAEFDAKKYYRAVSAVKLNEDILKTLGADDLPIETLNLNKQQCERIQLARAIYSDRDLYIFDQPFKNAIFSSMILQMLANVVDTLLSDPNKAVLINSTNNQVIYFIVF